MRLSKRMSSGQYLDLNNFSEDDLTIEDVSNSLNQIKRFTGHWRDVPPLTVAQHSLLCLTMAELFEPDDVKLHLAVFTHDFPEAIIGDVASPIKMALGDRWYEFANPIEEMVENKFYGSPMDSEMHDKVKVYDLAALDVERRVLWSSQYGKDHWPASPLNVGTMENKKALFSAVSDEMVDIPTIWKGLYDDALHTKQS